MSGGSLDYFYSTLSDHAGDFNDMELDNLVSDLAELFHDREWYLSGDTGEGSWNEARDIFKKKWFSDRGRKERIEKYLTEMTEEVRRSFGISEKYCENCKHWSIDAGCEGEYGRCALVSTCLYHRREHCEKWEKSMYKKRGQENG